VVIMAVFGTTHVLQVSNQTMERQNGSNLLLRGKWIGFVISTQSWPEIRLYLG
jgi:hypothetical protein